jgi:PAS domain S-box-containing protein
LALLSLLQLPVAVIVANQEGNIIIFNNAAEHLFGYQSEEVYLHNVSMLSPEPISEQHPQFISRYLEQESPHIIGQNRNLVGVHKNGTRIPIEMSLSEITFGQARHFMAVIRLSV